VESGHIAGPITSEPAQ